MLDALDVEDFSPFRAALDVGGLFEVEFSRSEIDSVVTVGDLYDLLLRKFPPNEDNRKCAGTMAFYRLRRALSDKRRRKELSPSFELTSLDGISAKALFNDLEQATGLKLPPHDPTRNGKIANSIGAIGCTTLMLGSIAALVVLLRVSTLYGVVIGLVTVEIASSAIKLMEVIDRHDAGVIPEDCRTLGSLSRRTALLNYAALAKLGAARKEKVIWEVFTGLLSRELLFEGLHIAPSEIARETYFFGRDRPTAS